MGDITSYNDLSVNQRINAKSFFGHWTKGKYWSLKNITKNVFVNHSFMPKKHWFEFLKGKSIKK